MMAIPLVQIMVAAWFVGVVCGAVGAMLVVGLYHWVF